jgi:disulfide bond formation protein DsbB
MSPFAENSIHLLGTAVLVAQIAVIVFIVGLFIPKFKQSAVFRAVGSNAILLGFFFSLFGSLGTYFFSVVLGFEPCYFCWYQRMFLFPQVILFAIALWKKDERVVDYSIALSVIGGLISIYHYYGQMFNTSALPCAAEAVSCAKREFLEYGYITIPMMALTAFLIIILLMISRKIVYKQM